MPEIKEPEILASNLRRSVLVLLHSHEAECTRCVLLAPRENRGHVVALCVVIASSSMRGDMMRGTFVGQESMILLETGTG